MQKQWLVPVLALAVTLSLVGVSTLTSSARKAELVFVSGSVDPNAMMAIASHGLPVEQHINH